MRCTSQAAAAPTGGDVGRTCALKHARRTCVCGGGPSDFGGESRHFSITRTNHIARVRADSSGGSDEMEEHLSKLLPEERRREVRVYMHERA